MEISLTKSKREQLNSLSSFIDGSQVYGMNPTVASSLRAGVQGLLKSSPGVFQGRPYLPVSQTQKCGDSTMCFIGGETRTNENLGLLSMQILFLREHNRIATALSEVNPSWSDEDIYQETRKIVIAIMQNIIYGQWLPAVIGTQYAIDAGIMPQQTNTYYQGYNPNVRLLVFF